MYTSLVWCQALKHSFDNFSLTPLKIGVEKSKNIADRRQSEVRNFETAQHIDKQITDVSSTKRYQTCVVSPHGVLIQPMRKINKLQMMHKNAYSFQCVKFSAGWPILPVYDFSEHRHLPPLFIVWGCGLPKIFGD